MFTRRQKLNPRVNRNPNHCGISINAYMLKLASNMLSKFPDIIRTLRGNSFTNQKVADVVIRYSK